MDKKILDFIKNFTYTVSSNMLSLAISTLVVLIIPKLIGVEEYGYWQLYIFYTSYIGFLHFGWNDGIYLRYGGEDYADLDKSLFFSQYYLLMLSQVMIAVVIIIISIFYTNDVNKTFIFQMTAIALILVNVRYMLLFILQATNKIKEYAKITMMDRIIYLGFIIILLIFGIRAYRLMIIADLIGKGISLVYAMFTCKDIVFRNFKEFKFDLREVYFNMRVGIKLMLSNIASKFIIGFVKLGIEKSWDIETFGKVSLTLSISNLVMLFISALGVIMYPVLRKTEERNLPNIYNIFRDLLMFVLLGILIFYYPIKFILCFWIPDYAESLNYMAILFPMVLFEGKMSLLINTYLKVLRKERLILIINIITVIVSALTTIGTAMIAKNLDLTIFSIIILLALRSVLAEILLSKVLSISVYKDIFLELIMTGIFIITAWYIDSINTMVLYGLFYFIYLFIKRNDIKLLIKNLKPLMKSSKNN